MASPPPPAGSYCVLPTDLGLRACLDCPDDGHGVGVGLAVPCDGSLQWLIGVDRCCMDVEAECCADADCGDQCQVCNRETFTCEARCGDGFTCCLDTGGAGFCKYGECCLGLPCDRGGICCSGPIASVCYDGETCPPSCDDEEVFCQGCAHCGAQGLCAPGCRETELCCDETCVVSQTGFCPGSCEAQCIGHCGTLPSECVCGGCDDGFECVENQCVEDNPCEGAVCDECAPCDDGACVALTDGTPCSTGLCTGGQCACIQTESSTVCGGDSQCCSGHCSQLRGGICVACKPRGDVCSTDNDCCVNVPDRCSNGICIDG